MKQTLPVALGGCLTRWLATGWLLALLLPLAARAQTITGFAPTSGPIGTSVTFTGTGFNATASQNVVFFGATQAAVTAASPTSLTVSVPLGATYQYPTVTNLATALTAYAARPFGVTLNGAVAFAPKTDFTVGVAPTSMAIGDVDGDGKPDLVVTNSGYNTIAGSSTVSVLRNTTPAGGAASFAAAVNFTADTSPYAVTIGDVDGDGRPDLAVANFSGTVSVLRNTTPAGGAVSFAATANFATGGTYPISIVMGDVDGDGKPDLAVATYASNSVAVLRNTTVAGGAPSFATAVSYPTGSYPQSVAIGDVDGDGKPDLALGNYTGSSVSVLRNTAVAGGLNTNSFAAAVNYATGSNPRSVVIGDVDGDGKPDLAVALYGSNSVAVLRNTAAAGGLNTNSFAAAVNFIAGAAPESVAIGDVDGDGKPDLAVANNASSNVSVLRNTAAAGGLSASSFAAAVTYQTGQGPYSVVVGDVDGDGKPDLATANFGTGSSNSTVSVLSQVPPAVITSFTPTRGPIGTSVTLTGTSLSNATRVTFNGTSQTTITANTTTSLTVVVPAGATTGPLTVTTGTNNPSAPSSQAFTVVPAITSFTPLSGPVGVSVTITGTGLGGATSVSFNGTSQTTITANTATSLTVTVPAGATTGPLTVTTAGGTSAASSQTFTVVPVPVITSFTPTSGPIGTSVTLTGTNLDNATKVTFNGTSQTTITNNTSTSLTVVVPAGATTGPLVVTTGTNNPSAPSSQPFTVVPAITNVSPLSGPIGASVTITGTGLGGATSVSFNGTSQTTITANTATSLTVTVPAGATTGPLTVTTAGGTSAASSQTFTVAPVPVITSFTPTSGPVSTSVTITGTNLSNATSVSFNNTASQTTVTANTATSLTVAVPAGATTGPLVVTTGGNNPSAASSQSFTVVPLAITSFAPTSGPIGTSVTFTGTGFDPTASQNVVFFGATQAAVTAASPTSLTVTVPLGATFQYPTVTNLTSALTAYAAQPFGVTLNGAVAFAGRANFGTGTGTYPAAVVLGDVNGDGLPDLATANSSSSTISVLRNTTVAGGTTSFAAAVSYSTGTSTGPRALALGDVDGDGKPDLVVANSSSNSVSVLRNTTVAGGAASFAAAVNFTTGANPYSVAIGDVDGDGRPDLATANYGYTNVSVLRNTAVAGGLNANSFATAVNYSTSAGPRSVALGDVDGDGKPDLLVGNYNANTISVFRNTATAGGLSASSFATAVSYPTGSYPVSVTTGDVDGDGKPELLVANSNGASVSVLRNTAAAGGLSATSFAAAVNYPTGTGAQSVAIGDVDGDGKPDLAVANNNSSNVSVLRNTAAAGGLSATSFATAVNYPTGANPYSVALGDVDGDGNPDLTVANFGNANVSVLRQLDAPVITSLSATSGPIGLRITITGRNLGGATSVSFNGTAQTTITANTFTSLTVAVPAGATTGLVTVTTPNGTSNGLTFTVTCAVTAQAQNVSLTLAADGTATLAASAVDNGSSSPCGAVTLSVAPASFTCANLGANQVTLTATAPDGTTATATATATVSAPAGLASTTWTGAASADASDCRNWSYGQLPTASISAVVPAGTPYAPALPAGTFATLGLSVASGTTFSTSTGTTLQVSGDLSLDGSTTFAGPVQLVGAANQTLGGQTAPGFSALTLAKPAGTTVQLQRDLPIGASLTLSGGVLATASYAVQLGTSGTLSETDASYVLGNVAATRTLAPGTAESFGGMGLTLTPAAGSVAPGLTPVVRTTGTVLTGVGSSQSIKRYFDIQPATDQGLNVAMDFSYFAHELNNIAAANLTVFKSATTAGPWQNQGQSGRTTNAATASGTVSLAGISSFSIWTLGDAQNPLPVTLTSFTATAGASGTVRLAWTTASEVNSARYEVERSADGVTFAKIGTLAAAGTSSQAHAYALIDASLPVGASQLYYRLWQVDADGAAHYSVVRVVALGGASAGLSLYPNPAHGGAATLLGAAPGTVVQVLDALGRAVATAPADAAGTAVLALPQGLAAGVYVVRAGSQALRLTVE